jgi:hypothetical protein
MTAAHAWFWERAHDTAWIAAPLLLILVALLLRRSRIAWWVFVVFSGLGLAAIVLEDAGKLVGIESIVGGLVGLVEFGLLVSSAMRRFMRFEGRLAATPS